jgi:hypothetical protein
VRRRRETSGDQNALLTTLLIIEPVREAVKTGRRVDAGLLAEGTMGR